MSPRSAQRDKMRGARRLYVRCTVSCVRRPRVLPLCIVCALHGLSVARGYCVVIDCEMRLRSPDESVGDFEDAPLLGPR